MIEAVNGGRVKLVQIEEHPNEPQDAMRVMVGGRSAYPFGWGSGGPVGGAYQSSSSATPVGLILTKDLFDDNSIIEKTYVNRGGVTYRCRPLLSGWRNSDGGQWGSITAGDSNWTSIHSSLELKLEAWSARTSSNSGVSVYCPLFRTKSTNTNGINLFVQFLVSGTWPSVPSDIMVGISHGSSMTMAGGTNTTQSLPYYMRTEFWNGLPANTEFFPVIGIKSNEVASLSNSYSANASAYFSYSMHIY